MANNDIACKFTPTLVIRKLIHGQENDSMTGFIQLKHCVNVDYYHFHLGYRTDKFTIQVSNNSEGGLFRITFFGKNAWKWSKILDTNMVIEIDGGLIHYPEIHKKSKKSPEIIFTEYSEINILKKEFFEEKTDAIPTFNSFAKSSNKKCLIEIENLQIEKIRVEKNKIVSMRLIDHFEKNQWVNASNLEIKENEFKKGQVVKILGVFNGDVFMLNNIKLLQSENMNNNEKMDEEEEKEGDNTVAEIDDYLSSEFPSPSANIKFNSAESFGTLTQRKFNFTKEMPKQKSKEM